MIDRRLLINIDWVLAGLVVTVCLLGILNIYSATAPYKIIGTAYYIKQFYWMLLGIIISLFICSLDYHILEDLSYWFYGFLLLLLIAVLLVGKRSMGATRWLNLGFFTIQPSELMKLVIIVTFARFFNNFQSAGPDSQRSTNSFEPFSCSGSVNYETAGPGYSYYSHFNCSIYDHVRRIALVDYCYICLRYDPNVLDRLGVPVAPLPEKSCA